MEWLDANDFDIIEFIVQLQFDHEDGSFALAVKNEDNVDYDRKFMIKVFTMLASMTARQGKEDGYSEAELMKYIHEEVDKHFISSDLTETDKQE